MGKEKEGEEMEEKRRTGSFIIQLQLKFYMEKVNFSISKTICAKNTICEKNEKWEYVDKKEKKKNMQKK